MCSKPQDGLEKEYAVAQRLFAAEKEAESAWLAFLGSPRAENAERAKQQVDNLCRLATDLEGSWPKPIRARDVEAAAATLNGRTAAAANGTARHGIQNGRADTAKAARARRALADAFERDKDGWVLVDEVREVAGRKPWIREPEMAQIMRQLVGAKRGRKKVGDSARGRHVWVGVRRRANARNALVSAFVADKDGWVSSKEVWDVVRRQGRTRKSQMRSSAMGETMHELFGATRLRKAEDGKRVWGWKGISWREGHGPGAPAAPERRPSVPPRPAAPEHHVGGAWGSLKRMAKAATLWKV